MSGANYEYCPVCDRKALYVGEDDIPDGIVIMHKACAEQELAAATLELAQKLASKSPLALQIGKEGLNQLQDLSYHQGLDAMDDLFATLASTEDAIVGVSAFRATRKPGWKER